MSSESSGEKAREITFELRFVYGYPQNEIKYNKSLTLSVLMSVWVAILKTLIFPSVSPIASILLDLFNAKQLMLDRSWYGFGNV